MGKKETSKTLGWSFLILWGILILMGIVAKRIYEQPDLMVFFHLPAAVFLVLAGYVLSRPVRERYSQTLKEIRSRATPD